MSIRLLFDARWLEFEIIELLAHTLLVFLFVETEYFSKILSPFFSIRRKYSRFKFEIRDYTQDLQALWRLLHCELSDFAY